MLLSPPRQHILFSFFFTLNGISGVNEQRGCSDVSISEWDVVGRDRNTPLYVTRNLNLKVRQMQRNHYERKHCSVKVAFWHIDICDL